MATTKILGRIIEAGGKEALRSRLHDAISQGRQSVYFCNVHMLMLSQEEAMLASAMDTADLVIPDGVPISWVQHRLGVRNASVFRGYEAVNELCAVAANEGKSIGFFGSTEDVLSGLSANLKDQYRDLEIRYLKAPPPINIADLVVDDSLIETINSHNLNCLFIGLGCPKQEIWIKLYSPHLNCSLLGVGAAFDWLAGTIRKPPIWMEKYGLAWLFRLMQNPIGMWHRYLVYNSKFLFQLTRMKTT